MVQCIACDRDQSKIVLGYIRSYFAEIPDLAGLVTREGALGLELRSGVNIAVTTNSFRQVRGRSILLSIFDECAFWKSEDTAKPDYETYRAILPGMATLPGSMLVAISSPYRKAGLLYEKWETALRQGQRRRSGYSGDEQAAKPDVAGLADRASAGGGSCGRSEQWLGMWRNDIAGYLDNRGGRELCRSRGDGTATARGGSVYCVLRRCVWGSSGHAFALG